MASPRVYHLYAKGDTPNRRYPNVMHVKNVGWLLRHASEVTEICVSKCGQGPHYTARLSADGKRADGTEFTYMCDFGSFDVACRWVRRPSLRHAKLDILD